MITTIIITLLAVASIAMLATIQPTRKETLLLSLMLVVLALQSSASVFPVIDEEVDDAVLIHAAYSLLCIPILVAFRSVLLSDRTVRSSDVALGFIAFIGFAMFHYFGAARPNEAVVACAKIVSKLNVVVLIVLVFRIWNATRTTKADLLRIRVARLTLTSGVAAILPIASTLVNLPGDLASVFQVGLMTYLAVRCMILRRQYAPQSTAFKNFAW